MRPLLHPSASGVARLLPLALAAGVGLASDAPAADDWLEPGPHEWGHRYWHDTITLHGEVLPWDLMINYPADTAGEGVPVLDAGGPFPIVFFQHAGGSDYDWYDDLFERLAQHGIVLVSARHQGPWEGAAFDDKHRDLFIATMDRAFQWNADPSSFLHQKVDAGRIGLSGHSHGAGAALYLMTSVPDLPYDIRSLSLIAPCPLPTSLPIADYAETYAELPSLQVIYGSKDSDGCVAFGQAIAVYETRRRPRHYAYVDGASHHVFDDFGGLGETTISRADAARALAVTMVPFHALHLNGDTSALPALRGEKPLSTPTMHIQFHEAERLVVDDFEDTNGATPGVAIVGLPGQTFVNGFLGDTFVDYQDGVQLIRAEIRALVDSTSVCHPVLFFEDNALGADVYADAIAAEVSSGLLCAPVSTSSRSEFAALIGSNDWGLIISANQDGSSGQTHLFDAPLRDYLCDGGRAIISDFRVHSPTAAEVLDCAGAAFDGTTNWMELTSTGSLFAGTLQLWNPGWGIATYGLEPRNGAVVHAVNELVVPGHDPYRNSLGLPVTPSGDFDTVAEADMLDPPRTLYHPTWGLELAWDSPGASLIETLAAPGQLGLDAQPWVVLSLRLLQRAGDPLNPPGVAKDFHVRLTDAAGASARVALSESVQGGLRYPAPPAAGVGWKSVFETYRIELDTFVRRNPGLDLGALVSIAFEFDLSAQGRVYIDDIEFATRGEVFADVTGDGVVDVQDVLAVLAAWGACPVQECPGDVDADGQVGVSDLLLVLAFWS